MTTDEKKLVSTLEENSKKVLALAGSSGIEPARIAALTFASLVGCILLGAAVAIKVSSK